MFRKNEQHLQMALLSGLNELPDKLQEQLEQSWAETFYKEIFVRIDEEIYAPLYADEPSRPNIPVNVLVGLEMMKDGNGWSDQEMYEHYCYNIQVRYALGLCNLGDGHFDVRTMYNFRQRLSQHMQETGENLFEKTFEQVTDEQIAAYTLKTNQQRMDSTQIGSNIREMSRLQLVVEVLQRVHRVLTPADQAAWAEEFGPYLKGSSGQYLYQLKGRGSHQPHLVAIGVLMQQLVTELAEDYSQNPIYQMLERVFSEQFRLEEATVQPKAGKELSASSLQSPDDLIASYRQKGDEGFIGYVANAAETCHPDNDFQLITKMQTEPNTTDDADMLAGSVPDLKKRTDLQQMHTDGAYGSPEVDAVLAEHGVELHQTAIRGRQPDLDKTWLIVSGNWMRSGNPWLWSPLGGNGLRSNPVAPLTATFFGSAKPITNKRCPRLKHLQPKPLTLSQRRSIHLPRPSNQTPRRSCTSPASKLTWPCAASAAPNSGQQTTILEPPLKPQWVPSNDLSEMTNCLFGVISGSAWLCLAPPPCSTCAASGGFR